MSYSLTRRLVLTGAIAQFTFACGGGRGNQPTRGGQGLNLSKTPIDQQGAADICQQLRTSMQEEVFRKVQACREIMHKAGIAVTAKMERQEIGTCMERIKRLFDLDYVTFRVNPTPVAEYDGRTWTVDFTCDVPVELDGRQFVWKGRGKLKMYFAAFA